MKKFLISLIVLLSVYAYAEPIEELIGIPPVVQGVWSVLGTSNDGGITIQNGNNQPFCRVSINRILNTDGSVWTVKRIISGKGEDGKPFLGVSFNEITTVWCITPRSGGTILVQVFNEDMTEEVMRVLFRVVQ